MQGSGYGVPILYRLGIEFQMGTWSCGGIRSQSMSPALSSCIRVSSDMQSRTCKLHICHSRPALGSLRRLGLLAEKGKKYAFATRHSYLRFAPVPNAPGERPALDSFDRLTLNRRCCSLLFCMIFASQFLSKSARRLISRR